MDKVIFRTIATMCTLFSVIALFGYLSLLTDVPPLIVMRRAPNTISNDGAMVFGRFLICLTLVIGVPLNLHPCRSSIEKLCFKVEGTSPLWIHILITLGFIIVTMTVAIVFPNIVFVFSFLGGFCGTIMAIIIPALLHVKLSNKPTNSIQNIIILSGMTILSCIGFTAIIINIVNIF